MTCNKISVHGRIIYVFCIYWVFSPCLIFNSDMLVSTIKITDLSSSQQWRKLITFNSYDIYINKNFHTFRKNVTNVLAQKKMFHIVSLHTYLQLSWNTLHSFYNLVYYTNKNVCTNLSQTTLFNCIKIKVKRQWKHKLNQRP